MDMNPTTALIVVAAVLYVLIRRFTGEPLEGAAAGAAAGAARRVGRLRGVADVHRHDLTHAVLDGAVLGAGAVLAVAGGLVRGLTVRVFVRDGHLWYRYTALTVVVWVALIGAPVRRGAAGRALGADAAVLAAALPFMLGLSLLGEAAVVGRRGIATGVPFAPGDRGAPPRPLIPRRPASRAAPR